MILLMHYYYCHIGSVEVEMLAQVQVHLVVHVGVVRVHNYNNCYS